MTTDVNGCSTTTANQEQYESFDHPFRKGIKLVQYDFRHESGELFSCVRHTLERCRAACAVWMVQNNLN